MKYRINDILCVKLKNEKILIFVFNNQGTKIKNISTNEIINCKFKNIPMDVLKRSLITLSDQQEVKDFFNKLFGKCELLNLEELSKHFPQFYKDTHYRLDDIITKRCKMYNDYDMCIDDKTLKVVIKSINKYIDKQKTKQQKQETKVLKIKEEIEMSQEF